MRVAVAIKSEKGSNCLRWGVHLEVKFVCSRRAKCLIGEGSEDSCYATTKSPRLSHGTGNRGSEWFFDGRRNQYRRWD